MKLKKTEMQSANQAVELRSGLEVLQHFGVEAEAENTKTNVAHHQTNARYPCTAESIMQSVKMTHRS